jgi:hypothetical protein
MPRSAKHALPDLISKKYFAYKATLIPYSVSVTTLVIEIKTPLKISR